MTRRARRTEQDWRAFVEEQAAARRALARERFAKMMDDHMASVGTEFTSPRERVIRQALFAKAWCHGFLYAMKIFAND